MENDYSELKLLGISNLSIACYKTLHVAGPAHLSLLATNMNRPAPSVFRCLERLHKMGFVDKTKANMGPMYYSAVMLEEALDKYHFYLKRELSQVILQQLAYQRELRGKS